MKNSMNQIHGFLSSKKGGWIWLSILLILFGIRIWLAMCTLWLCGLFVATVVAYTIFTNKTPS